MPEVPGGFLHCTFPKCTAVVDHTGPSLYLTAFVCVHRLNRELGLPRSSGVQCTAGKACCRLCGAALHHTLRQTASVPGDVAFSDGWDDGNRPQLKAWAAGADAIPKPSVLSIGPTFSSIFHMPGPPSLVERQLAI